MDATLKLWNRIAKENQKTTEQYILEWLQANPKLAYRTTSVNIAKEMKLHFGCPKTLNTIRQTLQGLVRKDIVRLNGNKMNGDYYINYSSKQLPKYILENAPDDIKEHIIAFRNDLKANQYIDEMGCKVTKPVVEEKPTVKEPVVEEEQKEKPVETTITEPEVGDKKPTEEVKSSSNALEENTTSVPIKIEDTKSGLSISITLNLNINK